MKISDLILPFKPIIFYWMIIPLMVGCESRQEPVKNTIPAKIENRNTPKPEPAPAPAPVAPPDSVISPDTVESHDRIQKKPEIKAIRRVLNFHKKPLIT